MIVEPKESESEIESTEPRFSGWRKAIVWVIGAAVLAVVGHRGALGTRMPVEALPIGAADDRQSPPSAATASVAVAPGSAASRPPSSPAGEEAHAGAETPPATASPSASAAPDPAAPPAGAGSEHAAADPSSTPASGGQGITSDGRIVLNLATEAELRKLPGIGKSRARAIIERRERVGRFRRLEDLLRVKGIGPKRLAALRAKIVLDAPQ